jgi:surface antigen
MRLPRATSKGQVGKQSTKSEEGITVNTTTEAKRRHRPVLSVLLLAGLTAGLVTVGAKPALADMVLCSGTGATDSACTTAGYTDHGYAPTNMNNMYWSEYSGINCTNYVAYAESTVNGAPTPSPNHLGYAYQWANNAQADGFTVNGTPVVGSVAQWNAYAGYAGQYGHVAYVKSVNSDQSITVSEDNVNGGQFDWRTITPGSSYWPNNFIHFKNIAPSALVRLVATSDGHTQLFQVTNGVVEQNWFSPATGATGNWVSAAGMPGGVHAVGNPAVVPRPGQQVIDVFAGSSDGLIRETWYNWGNGAWGGWIAISGATFTGDPQAVATADGHDQIFADANGVVEQNWFSPATGATGNWKTI